MARRTSLLALSAIFASSILVGCGANTASRGEVGPSDAPPQPAKSVKADSGTAAQPPPVPVAHADSTSPDPRPQVLVEGIEFSGVRTRLIPHVMGRGWMLSVNKGDSIEFIRPADANLSQALYGLVPPNGTKLLLRFRLKATGGGTQIEAISHLIGKSGILPYKASSPVLAASLEDLRHDLLTAPVSTETQVDRVKK